MDCVKVADSLLVDLQVMKSSLFQSKVWCVLLDCTLQCPLIESIILFHNLLQNIERKLHYLIGSADHDGELDVTPLVNELDRLLAENLPIM